MREPLPGPTLLEEIQDLLRRRPEFSGSGGVFADRVLLGAAERIDRCYALGAEDEARFLREHPLEELDAMPAGLTVACPGVMGAFTHMAVERMIRPGDIRFFEQFPEVLQAVQAGEVPYGVLPVENSTAGAVTQTLDLVAQQKLYVCRTISIKIEHSFCAHPDTDPADIRTVLSHPQALAQCSRFIWDRDLKPSPYSNTATAAKKVGEAPGPTGCICSRYSAELYGLKVLEDGVQDYDENYTRFILVSTRNRLLPDADRISLSVSFPNQPGALNQLLTQFAACRIDLLKLVSMPIASRDFNVRFHLDFTGSVRDRQVAALLGAMEREYPSFHYLGNYDDVTESN